MGTSKLDGKEESLLVRRAIFFFRNKKNCIFELSVPWHERKLKYPYIAPVRRRDPNSSTSPQIHSSYNFSFLSGESVTISFE